LLPKDAHVTIIIYNADGQVVRVLNLGAKQAGEYVIRTKAAYWNGRDDLGEKVTSGVYFYTLGSFCDAEDAHSQIEFRDIIKSSSLPFESQGTSVYAPLIQANIHS
jgi:flagellar hook assembly protein FlgD